jgi:hypothetical protein
MAATPLTAKAPYKPAPGHIELWAGDRLGCRTIAGRAGEMASFQKRRSQFGNPDRVVGSKAVLGLTAHINAQREPKH